MNSKGKINTTSILLVAGVIVVIAIASGAISLPSFGALTAGVPVQPGAQVVTTAGSGYQPVLSTTATDAASKANIASLQEMEYRINNLSGTTRKITSSVGAGNTVNVNLGENVVAWVKPNATYMATSKSYAISQPTTVDNQELKRFNTITAWMTNDSSNATQRNASNATDALVAGGTLRPTLSLQGVTAYRYWGEINFDVDYNASQIKSITPGSVTCADGSVVSVVSGVIPTSNALANTVTVTKAFKVPCVILGSQTLNVPLTVEAQASWVGTDENVLRFNFQDYTYFTDSVTGEFVIGIESDLGSDTNSATNPSALDYYTA